MIENKLSDLEVLLTSIKNANVRSYATDAVNCYYVGAYRASILSIWIALVLDLYKKAEYISENFNDAAAKNLIADIESIRKKQGKASNWEDKVLEKSFNDLKIINKIQYDKLDLIKKDRNLCAHPVLDEYDNLYQPTAEETRSHIVNAINLVLSQNAIFGKNYTDKILEILKDNYLIPEKKAIESKIKEKYLVSSDINSRKQLIKRLLKILVCTDIDLCSNFSEKFILTLQVMYDYKPADFETLKDELIKIEERLDNDHITYFGELCKFVPYIGRILTDDIKTTIRGYVNNNIYLKLSLFPFIEDFYLDVVPHALKMWDEEFDNFLISKQNCPYETDKLLNEQINKLIEAYVKSSNWNDANEKWTPLNNCIKNKLLNDKQIEYILENAPQNRGWYHTENNQLSGHEDIFLKLYRYSKNNYPNLQSKWHDFINSAFENKLIFNELKNEIEKDITK